MTGLQRPDQWEQGVVTWLLSQAFIFLQEQNQGKHELGVSSHAIVQGQ